MPSKIDLARDEALQAPQTVTWRDLKFTVAPPDEWLWDYQSWVDREKLTLAIEAMLGPEQFAQLQAVKPRPRMAEIEALIASVLSAFGMSPGESGASGS